MARQIRPLHTVHIWNVVVCTTCKPFNAVLRAHNKLYPERFCMQVTRCRCSDQKHRGSFYINQTVESEGSVAATYCETLSNYEQEARLPTACTSAFTTLSKDKRAPDNALANCKVSMPCSINLQQHTQGPLALAETVCIRVGSMTLIMSMNAVCRLAGWQRMTQQTCFNRTIQVTKQAQDAADYHGKTLGR